MNIVLTASDWAALCLHFLSLSLLGVGGAITTAPDMHRYLVGEEHWLSDAQFTSSIALAQAAPGPNVLFIALLGWHIGLNAATGVTVWWALASAMLGVVLCLGGIMLPSSVLTFYATRWAHRHQDLTGIKAFKAGMAPIVIGLLVSTGWLLTASHGQLRDDWPLWLLTAVATLLVWRTKLHILWLLGAGALLGGLGWV